MYRLYSEPLIIVLTTLNYLDNIASDNLYKSDIETAGVQTMTNAITPSQADPAQIARLNDVMQQAGQAANQAAARVAFTDHIARKAENTTRRKRADLALFETFLQSAGIPAVGLYSDPHAWRGISWGIVEAFRNWQLGQGYAIGSINGRLSTVRTYAKIAAKAGSITPDELRMIQTVEGYSGKEARHIDEQRRADGMPTRKANEAGKARKKAEAVTIPDDIAVALIAQPDNPKGRRDRLIMCLLLFHGLRDSEAAILTRQSFDMKRGTLTFYRPKVNVTQTHTLTPETREAARAYLQHAPADGILWRKSSKGTNRLGAPLSSAPGTAEKMINRRVELLGRHAGLEGLSPHDCRHYWATWEARQGTPLERLKDAGGWASVAMPARYVKAAQIANEGTARVK
jgi:integrase